MTKTHNTLAYSTLERMANVDHNSDAAVELGLRHLQQATTDRANQKANQETAVFFFQRAAHSGNADGMYHLARCYQSGTGVKEDPVEAEGWFISAYALDHDKATFELASCYEHGHGVKRDKAKALQLWDELASTGNADAMRHLFGLHNAVLTNPFQFEDHEVVALAKRFLPPPAGPGVN